MIALLSILVVLLEVAAPSMAEEAGAYFIADFDGSGRRNWIPETSDAAKARAGEMSMYEVTRYPHGEPSDEQRKEASSLHEKSLEAARKHGWFDFERGLADGYQLMFADGEHYVNPAYVADDSVLDPERPEFLMYYETARGPKLAGFMFLVRRPDERGPQVGGPLTLWHYHIWHRVVCLAKGMYPVAAPQADGSCTQGEPARRSPEMLHVWFVNHPEGPFATAMTLPDSVVAELASTGSSDPKLPSSNEKWTPPNGTRFKTRWDGTIYDRKSGLIWEAKEAGNNCARCAEDQYAWTTTTNNPDGSAFSVFLDRLNNTCNGDGKTRCREMGDCAQDGLGLCGLGGFHDWRLPMVEELRGLLLEATNCRATPCIDSSMPGPTQPAAYWSASADPSRVAYASAVNFSQSRVVSGPKTNRAYVRAVRGVSGESQSPAPAVHDHSHHH